MLRNWSCLLHVHVHILQAAIKVFLALQRLALCLHWHTMVEMCKHVWCPCTGGPYFAWDFNMVLYVGLLVQVLFSALCPFIKSSLPMRGHGQDKATKMSEQNVFLVATHMIFAALFTIQVFPYTYCAFHFFFTQYGLHDFMVPWSNSVINFGVISRLILYAIEAASRAAIRPNVFIALHHCLYFVFVITGLVTRSVFALKVMICLDLFAAWEFALFACLVGRKVQLHDDIVKGLLLVGITCYGLTRILQAVILGSLFAYGYQPLSHSARNRGIYWGFFVMCLLFVVLQLYTFVIYKTVWLSIHKAAAQRCKHNPTSNDEASVEAASVGFQPNSAVDQFNVGPSKTISHIV